MQIVWMKYAFSGVGKLLVALRAFVWPGDVKGVGDIASLGASGNPNS